MSNMQISKSDYMLFLRHPAWLWLKKHDKDKLPPIDEDTQAIFDAGYVFESYAEQLFPDAVKIGFDNFDDYKTLTSRTKKAIDEGAKTIIQAGFESGKITCICDVLVRGDNDSFDLYEIKSSTAPRPEHEPDLAFQIEVIKCAGYKVERVFVVHVNNEYIRNGEVQADELVKITEVTDRVKKLKEFTKDNIEKALEVIKCNECPDISPAHAKLGAFSDWLSIYKTMAEIDEYSIYHLCSPGADKIGRLEALGVKRIADIPDDFHLDTRQLRQFQATKNNEVFLNKQRIKEFLTHIKYPLYFLDYETLSSVVPYFDGLGPYKQLPFQYSLHVLESPDAEMKHFEYLHSDDSNPIKPLTEALKSQIGAKGTVLVWYEAFEKGCNELMGKILPEYEEFYKGVNERVIDLMIPFSTGSYVHKDFFGSASIKNVLPVLIPELSYKDLDIHAGNAAQRLWMEAVLDGKHKDKKDNILAGLLKYCELDTLAMVRIYQFLCKIS
jgi:hypothetical protein